MAMCVLLESTGFSVAHACGSVSPQGKLAVRQNNAMFAG
jgi:hypothetical protein